jgi:hypothetical protein
VGTLIIIIDSAIVLVGLIAFRSWEVPLYSWITIFVYGRVVDAIMDGGRTEKAVIIVSEKPDEISNAVLHNIGRGGTFLQGNGMYSGTEKKVIYTVVHRPQVETLKAIVLQIDPNAFISILPAYEIFGRGFMLIVLFGRAPAQADMSIPTQTQQQHLSCFISTAVRLPAQGRAITAIFFARPARPPSKKGFPFYPSRSPPPYVITNHQPPTTNYELCRSSLYFFTSL